MEILSKRVTHLTLDLTLRDGDNIRDRRIMYGDIAKMGYDKGVFKSTSWCVTLEDSFVTLNRPDLPDYQNKISLEQYLHEIEDDELLELLKPTEND